MTEQKEYITQEQVDRKVAGPFPLTDEEVNRRLHEAFGKCWHKWDPVGPEKYQCRKCGIKAMTAFPSLEFPCLNYCADPLLVLREMRKREDFGNFLESLWTPEVTSHSLKSLSVSLSLILDNPGKLARLALEWIERK